MTSIKVLFVCTGNICRSPTAEGIFRHKAKEAGLDALFEVDSAGTSAYHVGEGADARSQEHARFRGYNFADIRSRQVVPADYERFDKVIAIDRGHQRFMSLQAEDKNRHKIELFMDYVPDENTQAVPDPYYGGDMGFERVLDLVEKGVENMLKQWTPNP
jgi:protein-tyrosine phosphatase